MEILDEIIEWASTLSLWQQVAVVSALNNKCGESEIVAIAELCIREQEDLEAVKQEVGDPLKSFKYEPSGKAEDQVVITGIADTKNINAIHDGSGIEFGETGLTIVYGSNATGKSGYSRIFKAACMSRDKEKIHGNIAREDIVDPSTKITFKNAGTNNEYVWSEEANPSSALNTVHIFDTRTARIQLAEKSDVKYVPSGLDIFDKLADTFSGVKDEVQRQIEQCGSKSPNFELIFSDYVDTGAYEWITNLDKKEHIERLKKIRDLVQRKKKSSRD